LNSKFMGIALDAEDPTSYGRLMKDETDELITTYQDKKININMNLIDLKKPCLKLKWKKLSPKFLKADYKARKPNMS